MGILQIHKVEREGARLVFAFAGWTGKGKTYTAIQFGYGLAGYDATKLGFLDAENRRGSLCADILEQATRPTNERFLIADLQPPFSPARYAMGIEEFQAAGVEVLIVDSVTHEWEGSGGCQEIAEAGNPKMPRWDYAKAQHKKFMNKLLQSDMHIICCVRAREKSVPQKDKNGKTEFVDLGLTAIQEKNFMFEVTGSVMMYDEGMRQERIKVPKALESVIGRKEGYITADDGYKVREWVSGGKKLDPVVEKYRNRLISNTEGGVAHITECWAKTPSAIQEGLGKGFWDTLLASAKGYEEQAKIAASEQGADHDALVDGKKAEQAEAEALATKAREAAAKAPPPANSQTPSPEHPKPKTEPEKAKETPKPEAKVIPKVEAKPDPKPEPAKETVIKGVLPSDPVF